MSGRAEREKAGPDLGVLAGRLSLAVQQELFELLVANGFDDLSPRHSAVLANLEPGGLRATELARRTGQPKQVVATAVDELVRLGYLERTPDPLDGRAKLVRPTEHGLRQKRTADQIIARIEARHARRVGEDNYATFKLLLHNITDHHPH